MAFSGDVSVMRIDEVVSFVATNGLEGVLTICGAAASLRLYFRSGRILCPLPQGGRIDADALEGILDRGAAVREERARDRGRLDPTLVDEVFQRARALGGGRRGRRPSGRLARGELDGLRARADRLAHAERRRLVEEALHQVFRWDQARFEFQPGPLPERVVDAVEASGGLVLEPTALLMEVARRADEERRRPTPTPKGDTRLVERPRRPDSATRRVLLPPEELAPGARAKVLEGDLDGIGLAAVLQALRDHRGTGTLTVAGRGREEHLYFFAGDAFVLRDRREEDAFARMFLGEDGEQSVQALSRLVEERDLSAAEVRAVKDQFLEMLFWEEAEFAFFRDDLPPVFHTPEAGTTRIALDTDRFLLEAIQQLTGWDQLRRRVGGGDAVLRFVDFESKMAVIREGCPADLLTLVDGRHSVEDLVRLSSLDHLEVGRVLGDLLDAGVLEVDPERGAPWRVPAVEEALGRGEAVLVYFYLSESQGPVDRQRRLRARKCRRLEERVLGSPPVRERLARFTCLKLDLLKGPNARFAEQLGVAAAPGLALLAPGSREPRVHRRTPSPHELARDMDRYLELARAHPR